MKILQVIHGYPMRYNAGSEVYTQTLCHGLVARGHEVHVFTREEDNFGAEARMRRECDVDDPRVQLHVVNAPFGRDRYRDAGIDRRFAELLDELRPDVVHVGHLNHLSTSLLREAAARELPIVYTLHDYWLMCPRGQLMQMHPDERGDPWPVCDGQAHEKCARRCYARYFSGSEDERGMDVAYWSGWVERRMAHVRDMVELVDLFIAPARFLQDRYERDFGLPAAKLRYLDYGFARERMVGRARVREPEFVFGYIGTHIPAKGIDVLLRAFGRLRGQPRLRIWGRPRGQDTEALRALAAALPDGAGARVEWLSEYRNQDIVGDVFNRVDAIVVPSIWFENSPLVIHEAQQARVPVITADVGGMAEYVHHEQNGLLFRHRDPEALAREMQRFVDEPELARRLGVRGYIHDPNGEIPSIADHTEQIEAIYLELLRRRDSTHVVARAVPWRITFDTNPDTCNLKCVMCEEHSPHSPLQIRRKQDGRRRRVMAIDVLRRIVAEAAPHGLRELIPSTMGEPLLYEHFDEIVGLCEQYGIALNLTTNGTFPGRGAQAWAERLVPVLSDVKISINGARAETQARVMIGSELDKLLAGVRTLIAVRDEHEQRTGRRARVTFQLTFLEHNVDELADIVALAIEIGVDRVKGHHLWVHFDALADQSMRRSSEAIARWNRAVLQARTVAEARTLANGAHVLLDNIHVLDVEAIQDLAPGGRCPFLGEEAWVSAEGRFDPCCAPDAQRRSLGEFGYLHEQGLLDIWRGEAYQFLRASYRTRSLCLGCNMRRPLERDT